MSRRRAPTPDAESPSKPAPDAGQPAARIRIDKWLWFARFFKTRALAAAFIESGRLRVNGARVAKPGYALKQGDALTFVKAGVVRVIEVIALGERRGPAPEAATLYSVLEAETPAAEPGADRRPNEEPSEPDVGSTLEAPPRAP